MHSPLTLWHVTCGHSHENGCYGYESANNEIASGDSGSRRNHQSAATAPEAWTISCSTSLARDPNYWRPAQADDRRRYARPAGYSASREDHSLATRCGPRTRCTHNRHCHRDSGCSIAAWRFTDRFVPLVSSATRTARILETSRSPNSAAELRTEAD